MSKTPLEAPVLEGGVRTEVLAALRALAAELPAALPLEPGTLSSHQASEHIWQLSSASLFFAYLARSELFEGSWDETADELLDAAIRRTEEVPDVRPSLYGGVAGLGWVIHHVDRLREKWDPEATEVLDTELLAHLERLDTPAPAFDLMGGLVGLGVYGLEARNRQIVERVVDRLGACCEEHAEGLTWRTPPEQMGRASFPEGHFNLGLAHGVAGVLAFLADLHGASVVDASDLLQGAVGWLRRQKLGDNERRTFPWAVAPDRPPLTWGFDPGWAYSDAGIAFAVFRAGEVLDDRGLIRDALSIAEREARTLADVPVRNPGIGFGPAGFARIFTRWYQRTGRVVFRDAAKQALDDLLALRRPGKGVAGFITVDRKGRERGSNVGFLGGAGGIGLVLLAACSSTEPGWDRLLLLSSAATSAA